MKIINVRFSNEAYMSGIELPVGIIPIGARYNSWSSSHSYSVDVWADPALPKRMYEFRVITAQSELEPGKWVAPIPITDDPLDAYLTWRVIE
jgi:hypothetical protein